MDVADGCPASFDRRDLPRLSPLPLSQGGQVTGNCQRIGGKCNQLPGLAVSLPVSPIRSVGPNGAFGPTRLVVFPRGFLVFDGLGEGFGWLYEGIFHGWLLT